MKTYKGYDKLPYCQTHYPTTKYTAVSDTPENKRLKQNTAQQSSVVYHKDFENERGKYTAVADDPETKRAQKVQQQSSGIVYQQSNMHETERGLDQIRHEPLPSPPRREREPEPVPEPEPAPPAPVPSNQFQVRYRALYDYTAADDDEVSFIENDEIIDVDVIDQGWLNGRVERTGQYGMLPANYVQQV